MYKSSKLCIAIMLVVVAIIDGGVAVPVKTETQPIVRDIKVVSDIRDFAKTHPNLQLLHLSKDLSRPAATRDPTVRYTLGGRVTGDRLVAQDANVYAYPAKKDATIQLTYPQQGTGSIVTYVELLVTADTTDGNAYVVAGGVGQRFISVVVEANQTENLSYTARVYGTN